MHTGHIIYSESGLMKQTMSKINDFSHQKRLTINGVRPMLSRDAGSSKWPYNKLYEEKLLYVWEKHYFSMVFYRPSELYN